MSKRMILASGLFVACLALGACASDSGSKAQATHDATKTASVKTVNTTCPIGHEAVDPSVATSSFKGQDVGFCCAGCKGKFDKLSDADKSAKLSSAASTK